MPICAVFIRNRQTNGELFAAKQCPSDVTDLSPDILIEFLLCAL